MRKLVCLLGLIALGSLLVFHPAMVSSEGAPAVAWQGKVDSGVLAASATAQTDFILYLEQQADLSGADALATKEEKGRFVFEKLTAVARATQPSVKGTLDKLGVEYQSFWVTNSIWVKGNLDVVKAMAARPEVAYIYPSGSGSLKLPTQERTQEAATSSPEALGVDPNPEPNLVQVKADQVWAMGYLGQGVIVAGADTGVLWTHAALKNQYRGWNGTTANHNYNWHDAIHTPNAFCPGDSPEPCDDDEVLGGGHGSHTMGTIAGDDGGTNRLGMAPNAKWIACRNLNSGVGVVPTYMECMEWFIAPTNIANQNPDPTKAPHVINNSWGCIEGCPQPLLQDTLRASRAAGIFYAVSAGNDGSECNTLQFPLARYPESFSVGATDHRNDLIASFSSRGSVLGDPTEPTGMLTKPNISAPGVGVRSAQRDGTYASLSGTSMAGPHVAGLVALLINANPRLAGKVNRLEDIIEQTAVRKTTTEGCGGDTPTTIPNNTYGWGRIDALAAVTEALPPDAVGDTATTAPGTPVQINVLANDTDPDGDALTVTAVGPALHGTVTNNGNGTVTYTPAAGYTGADSFTYTICAPEGCDTASDTAAVTVQVMNLNDPPVAVNDAVTIAQGSSITINVLANDSDPNGNTLTVTAVSDPPNGTAVNNNNGTVTYTPDANFTGLDSFSYTISDGNGGTASANVAVTVIMGGLRYYPLPRPLRLLDTRSGQPACFNPNAPLTGGAERTQQARVTCDGVTIPANAQAIVGNATVVNNTPNNSAGFATLYPSDVVRPTVSNLNYSPGQTVPNAFTVGLAQGGANVGAFNIYVSSSTHFIVDVTGYYAAPGQAGLYYHALPRPLRLLDTRAGQPACDAPGQTLTAGQARTEQARVTCGGLTIPAGAKAIVGNATVVNDTGGQTPGNASFVTLYPSGVARPTVSNLNYTAGQIVPNAFTVALGTDGAFNIYATESINFIVDVAGYYSDQQTDANGAGLSYFSMAAPLRLLDTRAGQPACDAPGVPLVGGAERTQQARVICNVTIPASAQVIVGNATVVNDTAGNTAGFVTLYPSGVARPTASNLNYVSGQVVPNMFTVGLSNTGAFNIYATSSINFIVDVAGFFAP